MATVDELIVEIKADTKDLRKKLDKMGIEYNNPYAKKQVFKIE